MKRRAGFLYGLPIIFICFSFGCIVLLFVLFSSFKSAYLKQKHDSIMLKTDLVEEIISRMLEENKFHQLIDFCNQYEKQYMRISLIDLNGKVIADSKVDINKIDNHLNRVEVQDAIKHGNGFASRYSENRHHVLFYHARLIHSKNGSYILRVADNTVMEDWQLHRIELMLFLEFLLSILLVLIIVVYINRRIKRPLFNLQNAVRRIASGNLNTRIAIPKFGILRALALDIENMTNQLKNQLSATTTQRNEKNAIINNMSEAILLFSSNGEAFTCNHAAIRLFHLSATDLKFNIARCGIPALIPYARKTLEHGEPFEDEFQMNTEKGDYTLFIKGAALNDPRGRFLLLTITDLTNLRKLESFRSDFIANVSHEIKTPLTCIIGATEAIREEEDLSEEQRHRLFEMIYKQSQSLSHLLQDILSLASLERQQVSHNMDFVPVDLDSMLINTFNTMQKIAEQAGIKLQITHNQQICIDADNQLLEQAVCNLINNAIKYSGSPSIDLSLEKQNGFAVISVTDYGIGIPEEHQTRIFERFYRVHKERSRSSGGTGLGLAIVKHIAVLHGGHAELSSSSGSGCIFQLFLPLPKNNADPMLLLT